MIQSAARNKRLILPCSPIPNQIMINGINASGGTGRMNSTIGSNHPRNQFDSPIAKPSGMPNKHPKAKPKTTLIKDQKTFSHRPTFV